MVASLFTVVSNALALTKLSLMKTAGVVGDDLALNAKQLSHVPPERELPIIWKVAKGSLKNKALLSAAGIILSATLPVVIFPMLMVGGAYFCHEGVEKLHEKWQHRKEQKKLNAAGDEDHYDENLPPETPEEEKARIREAIKTDFILSAEIVVLTLGMVAGAGGTYLEKLAEQAMALAFSAPIMTGLVYGSVAGLVRIDNWGEKLADKDHSLIRAAGNAMKKAAPYILKTLTVAGTVAMFTVGGGLLVEGFEPLRHMAEHFSHIAGSVPYAGHALEFIASNAAGGITGVIAGIGTVSAQHGAKQVWSKAKTALGFGKSSDGDQKPGEGKSSEPAPAPSQTIEPSLSVKPTPDTNGEKPDAGVTFTQAAAPVTPAPPEAGTSFTQAAGETSEEKLPDVGPEQIPLPPNSGAGTQPN
jgi:uncharacterized protein